MYVLKEIVENSALGPLSNGFKGIVLFVFSFIVTLLMIMLVLLLMHGSNTTFHYGY